MENTNTFSISTEFNESDFGDKRLTRRLNRLGGKVAARPGDSFPEIAGSVADLEATYRFLANPRVTVEKIIAPHILATARRAKEAPRLVIAHDSTKFTFTGDSRREEIGSINEKDQGFLGHFALALSREEYVRPLGVLGFETLFRHGKSNKDKHRGGTKESTRESLRWGRLVNQSDSVLSSEVSPIHAMDREADDYALFSELVENHHRFVIRIRQNRRRCRQLGARKEAPLLDLFQELQSRGEREVTLSQRKHKGCSRVTKGLKARAGRKAKLTFAVGTFKIPKPKHLPANYSEFLVLNCVHVREINPPKNEEPVDWKLITTEPVEQINEVLSVVDDYRARWMIEEYFKALKTGCAYQKRQLETKQTLVNALAIFTPVAWQLLVLKTFGRIQPEAPAQYALTKNQIELLSSVTDKIISETPTLSEAQLAIASLGGHIPNNGPPGWIVLGRGMETLLKMEIAWNAAKWRCDQS